MKIIDDDLMTVYFSMGCFWRSESLFKKIEGVIKTEVGYAECTIEKPSCNDVFKDVPHKEVVKICFDNRISFKELLKVFFNNHTSDDRESFPVPSLYRSRVYVEDENLINVYNDFIKDLLIERGLKGNKYPISTKIKLIKNYKKADEHHQDYNLKKK